MIEEWRDIKNYEGVYQISSLGRIRSLDRYVDDKGHKRFAKGQKHYNTAGGYIWKYN